MSLDLMVDTAFGEDKLACLVENRDILLRCNITGYPRPESITFRKNSVIIVPGVGEFERIVSRPFNQVYFDTEVAIIYNNFNF